MLELGDYSQQEHINILNLLKSYQTGDIFLVGEIFSKIAGKYNYKHFIKVEQLCEFLNKSHIKKANVLIKGSRGIQLEKVLDYL